MKGHVWEIEVVSAPGIDETEFWKCNACGASGGPMGGLLGRDPSRLPPTMAPFLAGHGLHVSKEDCEEAARQIAAHLAELAARPPPNVEYIERLRAVSAKQKFALGQRVKGDAIDGWIDRAYLTLEAVDELFDGPGWLERQSPRPRTPNDGIWYVVVTPDDTVLVGQDDLEVFLG